MITNELVNGIKEWLGEDGIQFFKELKEKHGRVDAVWCEEGIPYMIHFREGTKVRNKMRDLTNFKYTSIEYDDNWVAVIEKAISN